MLQRLLSKKSVSGYWYNPDHVSVHPTWRVGGGLVSICIVLTTPTTVVSIVNSVRLTREVPHQSIFEQATSASDEKDKQPQQLLIYSTSVCIEWKVC